MTHTELNNEAEISAVILDLDGTLLHTESRSVLREFLATYGKVLITDNEYGRVGRTQKESAIAFVRNYELPLTPDQFIAEIIPFYRAKWKEAKALPGANRLIHHLHKHKVPLALASNSLREYVDAKISHHQGWTECFSVILGSDQVKSGKPSPDLFLEAAKRMAVDNSNCLVIEDSLVGVKAAKAAGMKVVAVPSQTEADSAALADCALQSLLEFQPELWGLPPFDDWVDKALPVDPIHLEGLFIDGFLAEIPGKAEEEEDGANALPYQVSGVYFGSAKVGVIGDLKVVVGIRHELASTSRRKIVCVMGESIDNLCGQQMHLSLVGYIRGFSCKGHMLLNLEINEDDISIANSCLRLPMFRCSESNGFSQ